MGMGMGGGQGVPRSAIIAEAKRQIRDLEGRLGVTRESIEILEKAVVVDEQESVFIRIERMLEAVITVQLTALRGNRTEGETKLAEMLDGLNRAESHVSQATIIPPQKRF